MRTVFMRLIRWLRQPVEIGPYDIDWQAFGRSFGRMTGGRHDYGKSDTPEAERFKESGRRHSGFPAGGPSSSRGWSLAFFRSPSF